MQDKPYTPRIHLKYTLKNDLISIVGTNINKSQIPEFLSDAIRSQINKGRDNTPSNQQSEYFINVSCDLSDDTFYISSNTGNRGLETGLLLHALDTLKRPQNTNTPSNSPNPLKTQKNN